MNAMIRSLTNPQNKHVCISYALLMEKMFLMDTEILYIPVKKWAYLENFETSL